MIKETLIAMVQIPVATVLTLGYPGIVVLMAIESSFIPLPSEIVMPPAGYLISTGEMSWLAVILAGTFGSLLGSYVNYALSQHLGRPLLIKYGRYFLIKEKHLNKCDEFFAKHGEIAIFVARLLPGVRHLISIPAGVSRMSLWRFSLYTTLGAGIWVSILTYIGYLVGKNRELIHQYLSTTSVWVVSFSVLFVAFYAVLVWLKKRRKMSRSETFEMVA